MIIEIITPLSNRKRKVWVFKVVDLNVILIGIDMQYRNDIRHNWKSQEFKDNSNKEKLLPNELPGDIQNKIFRQVVKRIRIGTQALINKG